MKIHWGNAILIFFICYISLLVFTVIKSRSVDHSLVAENYYQHDITYQKKYDAITNRNFLSSDLIINYDVTHKELRLLFGDQKVSVKGIITFYRASSKKDDFASEFVVKDNVTYSQKIPQLKPGKWQIKVQWNDGTRDYYKEEDIYINVV